MYMQLLKAKYLQGDNVGNNPQVQIETNRRINALYAPKVEYFAHVAFCLISCSIFFWITYYLMSNSMDINFLFIAFNIV